MPVFCFLSLFWSGSRNVVKLLSAVRATGCTSSAAVLGQKGFPSSCDGFSNVFFNSLKVSQISHIKTLHHSWPSNAPTSIVVLCLFKMYYTLFFIRKQYSRMVLFMRYVLKWPHQHQRLRLNSSASVSMIGSFPNAVMCEGWGHEVRPVFCRVIKITSRGTFSSVFFFPLFPGTFVFFLHRHEWQRFPTLANFFVSLLAVETTVQCSWMHKQALSAFLSHVPLLFLTFPPILSPRAPPPERLTCTPHTSQCLSHLISPILSLTLFSSPLSSYLPHLMPVPLSPFSPSLVCRQLRDWAQKHPIHHPTLHPP